MSSETTESYLLNSPMEESNGLSPPPPVLAPSPIRAPPPPPPVRAPPPPPPPTPPTPAPPKEKADETGKERGKLLLIQLKH